MPNLQEVPFVDITFDRDCLVEYIQTGEPQFPEGGGFGSNMSAIFRASHLDFREVSDPSTPDKGGVTLRWDTQNPPRCGFDGLGMLLSRELTVYAHSVPLGMRTTITTPNGYVEPKKGLFVSTDGKKYYDRRVVVPLTMGRGVLTLLISR